MSQLSAVVAADLFEEHRLFLWGLCYRLTGSAADADDLVQDTFARVIERPPPRTGDPWRPWLVKVATNLGRDLLRRRRRRGYVGPWLPAPVETGEGDVLPAFEPTLESGKTTEGRYELMESVSYAFLLALEVLTPTQRAVLLLRDVFDYSVEEAAAALEMTASNVKTTHHRARRAMAAYDRERCIPTPELQEQNRRALTQLLTCLINGDVAGMEALLAEDVVAVNDGGGEFFAARVPVKGRDRVMRFYSKIAQRHPEGLAAELRMMNGMPAVIAWVPHPHRGEAPVLITRCELGRDGRVKELYSILATRKLTGVRTEH